MATSTTPGPRSYEDFVPSSEWLKGERSDTLIVELPGFRKEHLKVQIDNYGNLRTSGERPLDGNRWRRFRKEFRVPDYCNGSEIRAKFENGILTVTLPRLITEAEPAPVARPPTEAEPAPVAPPPTQAPEPQAMPKSSEPEPDHAKIENEKGVTEKTGDVAKEETGKSGIGGLMVGMKLKRRQWLIKVAVAAVVMVGVGIYVAYKFKKAAEAEIGEQMDFDEF